MNNNMAQTSVEWLFYAMQKTPMTDWYKVLEQGKEKHKEEIINAYNEAYYGDKYKWKGSEEYFKQTYSK